MATQPAITQILESPLAVPPAEAYAAVRSLLLHIGEDPRREGLHDTPKRVVKALFEMTSGYQQMPAAILATTFDVEHSGEPVIVRHVRFNSLCEHHLLGFSGEAFVGYIPRARVVGLSKLARLVDCFARRLQVQERLTDQIANAIQKHLDPRGVGVVVKAHHSCMGCRGVGKPDADMVTTAFLGELLTHGSQRAEFLNLLTL